MSARRGPDGKFLPKSDEPPGYQPPRSVFGPVAAGLVTVQQVDAARVATTRTQRADQTRNEDIRRVVELLRDSHDVKAAQGQMLLTLWSQCQLLGLRGPTLLVGVPR